MKEEMKMSIHLGCSVEDQSTLVKSLIGNEQFRIELSELICEKLGKLEGGIQPFDIRISAKNLKSRSEVSIYQEISENPFEFSIRDLY
jgi:hypothetical protein